VKKSLDCFSRQVRTHGKPGNPLAFRDREDRGVYAQTTMIRRPRRISIQAKLFIDFYTKRAERTATRLENSRHSGKNQRRSRAESIRNDSFVSHVRTGVHACERVIDTYHDRSRVLQLEIDSSCFPLASGMKFRRKSTSGTANVIPLPRIHPREEARPSLQLSETDELGFHFEFPGTEPWNRFISPPLFLSILSFYSFTTHRNDRKLVFENEA